MAQAARQEDLPAAAGQPQLAHGMEPDATIVLPICRPSIRREATVLLDDMDVL